MPREARGVKPPRRVEVIGSDFNLRRQFAECQCRLARRTPPIGI
jgi:hypothetical protein